MPRKLTSDQYYELAKLRGMQWRGTGVPLATEKSLWLCPAGHEWLVHYSNVRSGKNCPTCSHERLGNERRLKSSDYEVLAAKKGLRWLGPAVRRNNAKTRWRCTAKDHQFDMAFDNLSRPGVVCPYCSGRRTGQGNSLATRFPEVAREWHPQLNGDLSPEDVTPQSNQQIWWQCKRAHAPWKTSVDKRTRALEPTGCPACAPQRTSRLEIRVFSELLPVFGDVRWRHKVAGRECDVYLPELKIGIEIDGRAWHGTAAKVEMDRQKSAHFRKLGVTTYRLRQVPLSALSVRDVVHEVDADQLSVVKSLLRSIQKHSRPGEPYRSRIEHFLSSSAFANSEQFEQNLADLPGPPPNLSLAATHPKLAKEWLVDRNAPITAEMIWPASHDEYWWQCPKVSYHQYKRAVSVRTNGKQGCPLCNSRKEVHPRDSLAAKYPEIAREWHQTKNVGISSDQVMPNSGKRFWWLCKQGHEWQTTPDKRVGRKQGCPHCWATRRRKSEG